jgi:cell wall-associated NlpC family hydrolase
MSRKTATQLIFFLILLGIVLSPPVFAAGGSVNNPAKDELQLHVVIKAVSYVGIAYRFGGTDARGVDCSGFITTLLRDVIPSLPRRVRDLYSFGLPIKKEELEPGDLVFFDTTGSVTTRENPSHVGLYIGDDHFIHAASKGERTGVIISSLKKRYYVERYVGSRRVLHLAAKHH